MHLKSSISEQALFRKCIAKPQVWFSQRASAWSRCDYKSAFSNCGGNPSERRIVLSELTSQGNCQIVFECKWQRFIILACQQTQSWRIVGLLMANTCLGPVNCVASFADINQQQRNNSVTEGKQDDAQVNRVNSMETAFPRYEAFVGNGIAGQLSILECSLCVHIDSFSTFYRR